jgi:hypothetical protein
MHCNTHNIDYQVQCAACGANEEAEFRRTLLELQEEIEAQQRHLKFLELQRDEMYQLQNQGEYDCPYCLYAKLKVGASSCPACQAEITEDQWRPILEFERAQVKEWVKEEVESQRASQKDKADKGKKHDITVYFLQILTLLSVAALYWLWTNR